MTDRALLLALVVAACADTSSATDLNPEGPPMIRQVRMKVAGRVAKVFAFGTHPQALPEEVQPNVQNAAATQQEMRIVIDELLVGNHLEEVQCRGIVDEDVYSRVPDGATPDDIARCSSPNDVLVSTCKKSDRHSLCLCEIPTGCTRSTDTGIDMVAEGEPVGVEDSNMDGATDDTRFIAGAVGLQCGAITVPTDLQRSYWNPSGDQNKPAQGGFEALGPAIALVPSGSLPTNVTCQLAFAPDVVDKQGVEVCAPADGEISAGCTPGDVSAFQFKVEPLGIAPSTFSEGGTGVMKGEPFTFVANVPLDLASVAGITIAPAPAGAVTITLPMPALIKVEVAGGLLPLTMYTVTVPVTVKDAFQQPLPAPLVFHFTTGA